MKKGILFDLDGTLWDSAAQVTHSWNQCLREKTERPEQFTVADMYRFMGHRMEVIAQMMFPNLPEKEQLRIMDLCMEAENNYLMNPNGDNPVLFPEEEKVLRKLSEDYVLGIVSNCQKGYIETYLNFVSFSDVFADFESAGNTGMSKGKNIRLVMERQGITDCIYVGDTQGDADAAKEAGIPFVHAAYGFGKAASCAAILKELKQLPDIVKAIL